MCKILGLILSTFLAIRLTSAQNATTPVCEICGCSFCPPGFMMQNPNGLLNVTREVLDEFGGIPVPGGQPGDTLETALAGFGIVAGSILPCSLLNTAAASGLIPVEACIDQLRLQPFIRTTCGCPALPARPTTAPVPAPTRRPVPLPTAAPVPKPTRAPVVPPTRAPAKAPTRAPVVPPTRAPVKAPTRAPVVPPTTAPIKAPTPVTSPTRRPLPMPTGAPLPVPTPVPKATLAPVVDPTKAPLTDAPVAVPVASEPPVPSSPVGKCVRRK